MATAPAAPKPAAAPAPAPAPAPNNTTVNGVNWSMPPAESVVYPVVSPANEFATAMYDAPGQVAQQQAQTAEAQATSQMAPLQVQEAKARIAQQQMETDDAMLQRILPVFQNNPQIAQSPQVQALLGPIMQRRGLDPKDPGSIQAVLQPPTKLYNELTPQEIQQYRGLPQAYRKQISGAPPEFYADAPVTPMTPVEAAKLYSDISAKEKLLGSAGYTPGIFLSDLQSAKKRLADAGMPTGAVDAYLSPDGTQLSDSFKDQYVGAKATEEIQHLKDLGINIRSEDAYRRAIEAEKRREFDSTTKLKYAQLSAQESRYRTQAAMDGTRLSIAEQNVHARWAAVEDSRQRINPTSSTFALGAYKALLLSTTRAMDDANNQLAATRRTIANMAENPQILTRPEVKAQYDALLQKATSLQSFIQTTAPKLQAEQNAAQQGIAAMVSPIAGQPVRVVPGGTPNKAALGSAVATDPKGRKVYNVGGNYVYDDMTPYTP